MFSKVSILVFDQKNFLGIVKQRFRTLSPILSYRETKKGANKKGRDDKSHLKKRGGLEDAREDFVEQKRRRENDREPDM